MQSVHLLIVNNQKITEKLLIYRYFFIIFFFIKSNTCLKTLNFTTTRSTYSFGYLNQGVNEILYNWPKIL